jgi:hypothetical protein
VLRNKKLAALLFQPHQLPNGRSSMRADGHKIKKLTRVLWVLFGTLKAFGVVSANGSDGTVINENKLY